MNVAEATRIGREALLMSLVIGGPALLVTVVVGTIVSLFQAVTQIHESTLTFLPKLLAVSAVLAIAAGWMAEETTTYGMRSFAHIATVTQ
jgi:flagellar biosynthetic protein FliQ